MLGFLRLELRVVMSHLGSCRRAASELSRNNRFWGKTTTAISDGSALKEEEKPDQKLKTAKNNRSYVKSLFFSLPIKNRRHGRVCIRGYWEERGIDIGMESE